MARFSLFFISGLIAFGIYLAIVLFLIFQFINETKEAKKYSARKPEISFSVALLEEKKEAKKIAKTNKMVEKQIKEIPKKEESASRTPIVGLGVKKLFLQVEAKKPIPKEALEIQSENDKIAKKKKAKESTLKKEDTLSKELEQIMANLNLKKTITFSVNDGEFDEFYAKIQEILASEWNPIRSFEEYSADVEITITNKGSFSYKIIKSSSNIDFDKALKEFLDIMLSREFPKFEGGDKTNIMVTFKTEV